MASTIERLQTKLAIATRTIAEREKARTDAETARMEADNARVDAEIAFEQAKVIEKAKLDATIARLKADQPAANAKGSRWAPPSTRTVADIVAKFGENHFARNSRMKTREFLNQR